MQESGNQSGACGLISQALAGREVRGSDAGGLRVTAIVQVTQALRSRGVAYNLAATVLFKKHELLIDCLLSEFHRTPPAGFHSVKCAQL